ncbi:MAG: alpha/beta fold hydrolase [Propionibacteriaceae bacterium]
MATTTAPHDFNRRDSESTRAEKVFVLVHGSFHGAWAFERLTPLLVQQGHRVVARDLPDHGLEARLPRAFSRDRVDGDDLATEVSPSAEVGLGDWLEPVIDQLSELRARRPEAEIVLLGHSVAGVVLNAVGEAVPDLVDRLVYLSALMPASGWTVNDCLGVDEFSESLLTTLLVADPVAVGAFRVNPRSSDPAYRARLKTVFADDVNDDTWEAATHLLTPDTPVAVHTRPVTTTVDQWGSLPRTYICCTADRANPLAAQRRYIQEADALTPANRTDVRELAAGHSAYLSQPRQLAAILLDS